MTSKPIATRTLYLIDKKTEQITLQIFEPKKSPKGSLWECEVKISGAPEGLDHMTASGVDSYQALTMALSMLQAMVNRYNRDLGSKLRFQDDSDPNLDLKVIQD